MPIFQRQEPDNSWTTVDPPVLTDVSLQKWRVKNISGGGFQGPIPVPTGATWVKVTMADAVGIADGVQLEMLNAIEEGRNRRNPLLVEGLYQEFGTNRIERYALGSATHVGFTIRGLGDTSLTVRLEFYA